MSDPVPKKILDSVRTYPNYKAVSRFLKPRIRNGEPVLGTSVVRVYVVKKVDKRYLKPGAVIPRTIAGIETDVVEIGIPKALGMAPIITGKERIRPLTSGISIGNWEITAGTLGWAFEKNGIVALGSNAHVFTPDPMLPPEDVMPKEELQPGPYHGGQNRDNAVADYLWHKQILPKGAESNCPIAELLAGAYNLSADFISEIFESERPRTRLKAVVENPVNNMDFAVALKYEGIEFDGKVWAQKVPTSFPGLIFAGSDQVGIYCKVKYMIAEGWLPIGVEPHEATLGELVSVWSWRLTDFEPYAPNATGTVLDESANVDVSYGDSKIAPIEDVVMTSPNLAKPGCSGSAVWRGIL